MTTTPAGSSTSLLVGAYTGNASIETLIYEYVTNRAEQYAGWYDKKAMMLKRRFIASRIVIAVAAVSTPVLTTLAAAAPIVINSVPVFQLMSGVVAFIVAVLVALEGVLQYQEQWKNYRTTEQYIRAQIWKFRNKSIEFSNLTAEEAFQLLTAQIESAIKDENEVTLNVLTRALSASQPHVLGKAVST